ncbi:MAG: alkaline phosphatase family protein [Thermoleophilia bacterium]
MRPIVLVLVDGLGDRASAELDGRTSNEAAATPGLDALCARGSNGLLWPLGPGRAPSSEVAHWAMLGQRPEEFPGRAVLEARGWGVELQPSHAYAYAALRPAERRDGRLWLTGRPGPGDEDDARALVEAIAAAVPVTGRPPLAFSLTYLRKGEAILAVRGGDERLTDSDAFFRDRDPVLRPLPLVPDATLGARTVEAWTRAAIELLAGHPINRARAERGAPPLTAITTKWWGRPRPCPTLPERTGLSGAIVAASPFLAGLAQTLGLEAVRLEETDDPAADLLLRLDRAARLLSDGATFVLTHQKAVDEAGHTKDPRERVRALERLDAAVARLAEPPFDGCVVCVTGDHATPTAPEVIHAGDPVPFALAGPGVRADRVTRFGELDQREGILGHLRGEDVMPVLLNAADRPLFLGSRPTPTPFALGPPAAPEALELP